MMNGALARQHARYLAGRLIDAFPNDPRSQIEYLYMGALSRPPTSEEVRESMESLTQLTGEWTTHLRAENEVAPLRSTAQWSALGSLCHAILSSAEFLYID